MRREEHSAALFLQVPDCGQSGPEPLVVRSDSLHTLFDGDVEIHPYQHPFASDIELGDSALSHKYFRVYLAKYFLGAY
jgi:hypothetical protein